MPDPVDRLRRVAEPVSGLVAGIRDEQWPQATPCGDWDVAALVEHLTAGNVLFAAAIAGADDPTPTEQDDRRAAYRSSHRALLAAFSRPGALDRTVRVPFGTVPAAFALELRVTELITHGWDLARATAGELDLPAELVTGTITFCEETLARVPPERAPFEPPRPAPAGAPAIDRLAALLGREVGAAPGAPD